MLYKYLEKLIVYLKESTISVPCQDDIWEKYHYDVPEETIPLWIVRWIVQDVYKVIHMLAQVNYKAKDNKITNLLNELTEWYVERTHSTKYKNEIIWRDRSRRIFTLKSNGKRRYLNKN